MLKQLFTFISLAVLLGSNLAAQSNRLEAKIPFDFQMGKASLPSGTYTIDQNEGIVRFRGAGSGAASVSFGADRKLANPSRGALVFQRYGNRYFLQAVQAPGSPTARYLPKSKAELALAKSFEKQEVILASAR
jgi:hypothetical protein